MQEQQFTPQLTKVLDTNTPRKEGLKNIYMLVAETLELLGLEKVNRDLLFGNMLEVTKKIAKVADAVDSYEVLEKKEVARLVKEAKKNVNPSVILAEDSSKLEALVEEVLSQSKSALDVCVKILHPLTGLSLNTYGGGGKKVATALRNKIPAELLGKAQPLIDLVEAEADREWMKLLKKYRDDQHYKNLGITSLRANSTGAHERPLMPGGQPVANFLSVIHVNVFTFITDFMACALSIKLPAALGLYPEGENLQKKIKLGIVNLPKPS